jgi:hypothetical protein
MDVLSNLEVLSRNQGGQSCRLMSLMSLERTFMEGGEETRWRSLTWLVVVKVRG